MSEPTPESNSYAHFSNRLIEMIAFSTEAKPVLDEQQQTHLDTCSVCEKQIEMLRMSKQVFLRHHPVDEFVDKVVANSFTSSKNIHLRRWLLPAVAALVLGGLFWVYFTIDAPLSAADTETGPSVLQQNVIQYKGKENLAMEIYVSRGKNAAKRHDGKSPLYPDDRLKFRIRSRRSGTLTILSIDDTGKISTYYSPEDAALTHFPKDKYVFLEGTIQLDDFLGRERIIALLTPGPVSNSRIHAAVNLAYKKVGGSPTKIQSLEIEGETAFYSVTKKAKKVNHE